jgi:hypothetical protein
MLGTPFLSSPQIAVAGTVTPSNVMFAFPRTADGFTGASAAKVYAPISSKGMHPPSLPNYNIGTVTFTTDTNALHLGSHYNWTYAWDTNSNKMTASPISVDAITKVMPFGRMYNTSITGPIGNFLDTTFFNASGTGGWVDSSGSLTEYVTLPLNGGPEFYDRNTSAAPSPPSIGTLTYTRVSSGTGNTGTTTSTGIYKCFAIGANVWGLNGQGVWIWNTALSTMSLIYSNATVRDIIFDGQRTVFASISNGVAIIDTETLAASAATSITGLSTNGGGYMAIDNTYLYVASRTAATAPPIYYLRRSTLTSATTTAAFTFSPTTGMVVAGGMGTPMPDYQGGIYAASTSGTTGTTQTMRLYRAYVDEALTTLNQSGAVNPARPTAGASMQWNIPGWWYDQTSGRMFLFGNSSTASLGYILNIYEINSSLATVISSSATTFANTTNNTYLSASNSVVNTTDYLGDLWIQPIRGSLYFGPKSYNAAEGFHSVSLASPYYSTPGSFNGVSLQIINGSGVATNASESTYFMGNNVGIGSCWTNGPRVYYGTNHTTTGNMNYWANVYSLYNTRGGTTGRLIVLG